MFQILGGTMTYHRRSGIGSSFIVMSLAVSLVLTATGCWGDKPKPDPDQSAAPAGLAGYPGQNADSTLAYLASLNFAATDSAFEGYITCDEPAKCEGADSVRVSIVPESRAHEAPMRKALDSAAGYVVARITNLDQRPFGLLGIAANETAYLWVGPMPSGENRIAVFTIDPVTGASALRSVANAAGYCEGTTKDRRIPAVHVNAMEECTANSLYEAPARTASNVMLAATPASSVTSAAAAMAFSGIRGLWFSCSLGCCEGRGFQEQN